MNRDEARAYFEEKGLTYAKITADDLEYLRLLCNERFIAEKKKAMNRDTRWWYWEFVHSKIRINLYKDQTMASAYLSGKGACFDDREVISFNRDGFIGICGAADNENTKPVIDAFKEWCDWLTERRKDHETR